MANGADAAVNKIKELLDNPKSGISTRTGLQLSLEISAENHKLLQQLLTEVKSVKQRSWGNWAWENPKKASTMALIFILIFISDFRQPMLEMIIEGVGKLLSFL